jgi:hypothetical protein
MLASADRGSRELLDRPATSTSSVYRLREMADTHRTPLSEQLRVIAAELDAAADRAEKEQNAGRRQPNGRV